MIDDGQTADPKPREAARPARPQPFAELLFHADLRRVGDRLAPSLLAAGPVMIGRAEPEFGGRPLNDPTISRQQVEIRWDGRAFHVRSVGRRTVGMRSLDGEPRTSPAPPGTLLAIGDRALILLGTDSPADPLGMVGRSPALNSLRGRIERAATRARTVRVHGETGSGKELVAAALHQRSGRPGPFVAVNCASLPADLADSQLFGHARGAFTGADRAAVGLLRQADGGTLFLDEVAELSLPVQAKLLRAVEDRRVRPVGGASEHAVDVLLVAATAEDLQERVRAGTFREDLFARLEAPAIQVPPLLQRPDDVARLFAHFVQLDAPELVREADADATPVPLSFVLDLMARPWPRNVRQLRKVVAGLAVDPEFGPEPVASPPPALDAAGIEAALAAHDYVQARAAAALGISRNTLRKLMAEHGFPRPQDLSDDEIRAALAEASDPAGAARLLRVSERGLKLRWKG